VFLPHPWRPTDWPTVTRREGVLRVGHERCCGRDVHRKTVVACALVPDEADRVRKLARTFGTMTADLLALSDWLTRLGVAPIAMESTGV
jgi:transposase